MKQPSKLDKTTIEDICSLSPVQEGMLYHYLKTPNDTAYVVRLLLSFTTTIDPATCQAAWQSVVANNEILRTVFRWEGIKSPVQVVLKASDFALWHQALPSPVAESDLLAYVEADAAAPEISLTEAPFQVALYTVSPGQSYLVIRHHHILYDGWSTGILVDEFLRAYQQLATGTLPQLHAKPSVKSFTEAIKKSVSQEGKSFWTNHLQQYEPVVSSPQSADADAEKAGYSECHTLLPAAVAAQMTAYAQQAGVTPSAVLYAAWGLLLLKRTGAEDLIFGTTVAGRNLPLRHIEQTVGLFINTLPLRIKSRENERVEQLILRTSSHLQERESFANYPLVELKQMALDSSEDELFSTLVVIENYPLDTAKMNERSGLQVSSFAVKENTHYDLTLSVRLFDAPELYFSYNTARWSGAAIARLQEQFVQVLSATVTTPAMTCEELDILSAEEKALLPRRRATPRRAQAPSATAAPDAMPEQPVGEIEHKLAAMWADVLHLPVDSLSVTRNFFELGGHSLRATVLISRMAKALNVRIPYGMFFKHATIRQLATLLAQQEQEQYRAIQPAPPQEFYPLSSAQQRLYFLHAVEPQSVAYNMSYAARLQGPLDREKLSEAFKKLVGRHESLRTSFAEGHEEPVQRIAQQAPFDISFRQVPAAAVASAISDFRQPFDIRVAPLLRVGVLETGPEEHTLLVDMHHLISDGVSRNIIIKDFIAFYNQQAPTALRLQYKDYAVWQNDQLLQKSADGQRQFWLKEFADLPATPELPTDFARPAVKSYAGNTLSFPLGEQKTAALKKLAAAEGTTMFALLLSVYTVLLAKLTGLEDLVVGTPVAARRHADLEEIVGMFVNTLPLRNQPAGALPFRGFLQAVKEKSLACLDNQEYPYEELLGELQIERDTSRNPLFDVLFAYEDAQVAQLEIPGLQLTELSRQHRTAKFDLTLTASESPAGLLLNFEYSTALFNADTIERFALYLQNVVRAVTENSAIPIAQIDILPAAEKHQLLQAVDNTAVAYPATATVIGLFEQQALRTPEAVALKWNTHALTYGELLQRVNALAARLRRRGVVANTIVALLMDRSLDTVVGMLAILKAGGAYLPIDTDYPEERIQYMITDSATTLLLTARRLGAKEHYNVPVVYAEDVESNAEAAADLAVINQPADLCYIIYTSGTTGNPKGVMIEHRNVVRLLFNDQFQFQFGPADTWTMFHSHCFDFSVWEMYGALLFGGKLIVIPKMVARDTRRYLQLLAHEQVTVLNQTPSAFYNLAQEALATSQLPLALRYVIFGGEALHPGKLKAWHERHPAVELINMFGITETTVHVTYKKITPVDIENNVSNIGTPIPTLSAYVCDKYQQVVAPGVVGELLVGGAGLARGYLNKPELTGEKFIPHFLLPGERLYRSGDLAKLLPSGDIVYLGRIDEQVKIRGFRIELGEIENGITAYRGVQEAAVVVKEKSGDKYLVAYYVSDASIAAPALKLFLGGKLPEHMVPAHYVRLEKIPLTSNNKLDRKALPEPVLQEVEEAARPKNQVQKELVQLWVEVLGVAENKIGLTTNFFDVGGSSLLLVKMVNKINYHFKSDIRVAQVFAYPVIASLAELLSENTQAKADEVVPQLAADLEQMSETISLFDRVDY